MSKSRPVSPDPALSPPPPASGMDYESHVQTYNRFVHLVKWFMIHMAFVVVALYFFIIEHNGIAGAVVLLAGIAVLLFGLFRNPNVRRDVKGTLAGGPVSP